jgi:hypothetical protein
MRIVFFALILLAITSCNNQPQNSAFDWKKFESRFPNSEKRKLLRQIKDPVIKGFEQMANETGSDQIFDSFHVIDLNGDGKEDMIYNGYGGAADEFVMVFINHDGLLKKDFHTYGHIEDLKTNKPDNEVTIFKPLLVGEEGFDTTSVYKIERDKIVNVKNSAKKR